jgi:hypothetical protein
MKRFWLYALLLSLFLAIFISPFACGWYDGLERVAVDKGFEDTARDNPIASPLPDYGVPGIRSDFLSTAAAGAIGALLTFGAVSGAALLLSLTKKR